MPTLGLLCAMLVGVPLLLWLFLRLAAQPCPRCGSQWRTECVGEWAKEEDWTCHACYHQWSYPLRDEPDDDEPHYPDDFPDGDDAAETQVSLDPLPAHGPCPVCGRRVPLIYFGDDFAQCAAHAVNRPGDAFCRGSGKEPHDTQPPERNPYE